MSAPLFKWTDAAPVFHGSGCMKRPSNSIPRSACRKYRSDTPFSVHGLQLRKTSARGFWHDAGVIPSLAELSNQRFGTSLLRRFSMVRMVGQQAGDGDVPNWDAEG